MRQHLVNDVPRSAASGVAVRAVCLTLMCAACSGAGADTTSGTVTYLRCSGEQTDETRHNCHTDRVGRVVSPVPLRQNPFGAKVLPMCPE